MSATREVVEHGVALVFLAGMATASARAVGFLTEPAGYVASACLLISLGAVAVIDDSPPLKVVPEWTIFVGGAQLMGGFLTILLAPVATPFSYGATFAVASALMIGGISTVEAADQAEDLLSVYKFEGAVD